MKRKRTLAVVAVASLATVAGVGVAVAASLTVTSKHLGASALSVPLVWPSTLTTTNSGTAGRIQANDVLSVTFSKELQASSICSGWTTSTKNSQSVTATATINDNAGSAGDDVLAVSVPSSSCSGTGLHFGTVDLGSSGYVSGTVTFTSSAVVLNQTTTSATLTLSLGTASGGTTATVTSGSPGVYTANAAIKDTAGNSVGANSAESATTVLF